MRRKPLPLFEDRQLKRLLDFSKSLALNPEGLEIHYIIRLIRQRLHMTQTQLAKRSGLPQYHIALIESGSRDPQIKTIKKIFKALFCHLFFLPKPQEDFDSLLMKQIKALAQKRISRVWGSMALENQTPDEVASQDLLKEEIRKLEYKTPSEIWDDA